MIIIPNTDLINACLSSGLTQINADARQVFFNTRNKFLLTPQYLAELQNTVVDSDIFSILTIQMIDNGQIVNPNITAANGHSEFVNISINHNLNNCFPVAVEQNFENDVPNLIVLNKSTEYNSHWIVRELICRGIFSLKYYDFKDNASIQAFFKSLFNLFAKSEDVYIFNRYVESNHLEPLRGKRILYFSYIRFPNRNLPMFIQSRDELRKRLGGKVRFQVTGNGRIIHERKIFVGSIAVTSDNSFENLTTDEPNWKIDVENDSKCLNEWREKIPKFHSY